VTATPLGGVLPPRVKVCHVITRFDTGGAERVLLQTVRRLNPSKFDSVIVSLRKRGPLSHEAERSGVDTIHLGMGRRPGPTTLWRLARLFQRKNVGIVHAYLYDAAIACRLAGRLARVPVVLTATRATPTYLPRVAWWLDRVTARWCQRIIAVSHDTADAIVRVESIERRKVIVIPNGVDLERFAPRDGRSARTQWGIAEDAFVVVAIGRLTLQKGYRYLFEALAVARRALPSITCLIAGDGPLRAALQAQVRALGLDAACRFLGDVLEIESVLAAADVTVLPSLFEGMPNVVLEAMAMGCPVIATAIGGSSELVRHGETGFLVPPRDATALASALVDMGVSADGRSRMGSRAREVAVARHDIDHMVRSVEKLYLDEWAQAAKRSEGSSDA
jgi:glycosyltransferase involved in cell wall biosynthesis